MKRAKFFWCTSHHGNGMWFKFREGWRCFTCEATITGFQQRDSS